MVDGVLGEAVWQQAARLTGFSRHVPTDDVAADDSTEVFVWYSPIAIHFGIRAFAEPGTVPATLADRDRMYSDDYIGIFLGTFNDGRQATVFAANPLGVQGDGVMVEIGRSSGGGFGALAVGRDPPDINPDFVFQSKGRVTDTGYEIEIRIPFKSLRYPATATQTWGFAAFSDNQLQLEWLFSHLPTPGTVIYLGYGSTLREPESFRFCRLDRERNSYFIKMSYLIRR